MKVPVTEDTMETMKVAVTENTKKAKVRTQRANQMCAAMKRAQIAAAKKAVEFGQLLYVARKGKVVGVDPLKILKLADEV